MWDMTFIKYEFEKFTDLNDFKLQQLRMHSLLVQQGLLKALEGKSKLDITQESIVVVGKDS